MGGWSAEALVREHAAEAAADLSVVDGSTHWTWAALDAAVDGVATSVRAAGVAPGEVVALAADRSADGIASILGVRRAGAVAALLPAGQTAAERAAALQVLRPVLVLDGGQNVTGAATPEAPGGPRDPDAPRDLEAPAFVILTSGTTGRPKGVVLSDRALAASAASWITALPPATGWLLAMSLGHVAGLGVVWRAIAGGVPVRIVDPRDTAAIVAALTDEPAMSHVSLVAAQLSRLLDAAGDGAPPRTLRAVLLGGGPIPPDLVTRAVRAGWPVVVTYGLSEAGSGVTALPTEEALDAADTAGRPLPGVRIRIEDPDADGVGEIVLETAARFSGYLGDPPSGQADPIRTGDLGRLDDAGRLVVVDRRTDRIVRGGENIAPAEVEAVLLVHRAVAAAAVVARTDDVLGQIPVAAVVLRPGEPDPGDEALVAHCRASLAGFKVPATFVRLDALPRTAGGKLRRDAVRALLDGAPTGELARPGGDTIGWRLTGDGALQVLLLPGTLSNAAQLDRLAAELARPGDVTVHAIDRRGTGTGRLADPRPLDVAVHVGDLAAYLDARGIASAVLVGVSFGAVVALELAARHPGRAKTVVAWEPPYGPLADPSTTARFARLADETAAAHLAGGPPAAAETFLRAVAGDAAWVRLPERARAALGREGDGALADSALVGLDPGGLHGIEARTTILTGGASEPFYEPIADALAAVVRGAQRRTVDGLAHPAPITDPAVFAATIRDCLEPRP